MLNIGKLPGATLLAVLLCASPAVAMDEVQMMLAERACQRLALLYSHYIDQGQASRAVDLFTDNGVWTFADQRFEGRAELRRFLEEREAMTHRLSRHVITNHLVDVVDANNATGIMYLVHLQDNSGAEGAKSLQGQPRMVGQYEDVYVRTEAGWRIKSRRASALFVGGEAK
ncbi:MAG: nuclear transport factor 2 family protein [Porticoccaceae bacterium]